MQQLAVQDLNWCLRRLPKPLRELMERHNKKVFVAGGYIRACVANEFVSDIDVFTNSKDTAEALAKELGKNMRVVETDNAYTVLGYKLPLQFIHRWNFSDPLECVQSFDFTIAKAALWFNASGSPQSCCADTFYQDLAAKRLVYCQPLRNEDAGGSMLRVLKFYQRGYRIPLDSLGAVIARLCGGVKWDKLQENDEQRLARIFTSLLIEVDPNADIANSSHLPPTGTEETHAQA